MRQDTAEGYARLGRVFAERAARLTRRLPLTGLQAAVLACFVGGALVLGFALQPRRQDGPPAAQPVIASSTDSPASGAPGGLPDAGRGIERIDVAGPNAVAPAAAGMADPGPAKTDTAMETAKLDGAGRGLVTEPKTPASIDAALDRLAGEIAAINRRLDAVIASDKERASRVATLTVEREPSGQAVPERDGGPSRHATAAAQPPRRLVGRDASAARRALALSNAASERRAAAEARRAARPRIVMVRLVGRPVVRRRRVARSIFGLPLHF